MNPSTTPAGKVETKVLISVLWITVVLNMLLADVLSLYIPGAEDELNATAGATPIPVLMLVAAIVFEIPIVMAVLSRLLKRGPSRWANIVTAVITLLFVTLGRARFPHYTFIMIVETLCLLVILWQAWKWPATAE